MLGCQKSEDISKNDSEQQQCWTAKKSEDISKMMMNNSNARLPKNLKIFLRDPMFVIHLFL